MFTKHIQGPVDINENSFDIIRAFCTYIVFFGHFITHFKVESSLLFEIAYIVRAVPVFFLFSGFLTAASLEKYSTKEFYIRRFFRIYPALWVCIIVNTIIIFAVYSITPSMKELGVYGITQFSFAQFYTGDWLRGYGVGVPNGALWTISSDIQFYIIAVVIARILKNKSLRTWIITIAVCALGSLTLGQCQTIIPASIYKLLMVVIIPYLYIFLFGMMVYYHKDKIIPFLTRYWGILAIIYLIWNFVPNSVLKYLEGVRYNVVTTILLMCLVIAVGFAFGRHRFKTDYSYGFYLYHMVVINFIYHMFVQKIDSVWLLIPLLILSSVIIWLLGALSQKFVDRKIGTYWQKRVLHRFCTRQEATK